MSFGVVHLWRGRFPVGWWQLAAPPLSWSIKCRCLQLGHLSGLWCCLHNWNFPWFYQLPSRLLWSRSEQLLQACGRRWDRVDGFWSSDCGCPLQFQSSRIIGGLRYGDISSSSSRLSRVFHREDNVCKLLRLFISRLVSGFVCYSIIIDEIVRGMTTATNLSPRCTSASARLFRTKDALVEYDPQL